MKHFIQTVLILLCLTPVFVFADDGPENEFKAASIYHFTKYIQWQDINPSETFDIAAFEDSGIIAPLQEISKKRLVNSKKINVIPLQGMDEIPNCHILFISNSVKDQLPDVLEKVKGKNILTISDSAGFASEGVAINFVIIDNKIRFEINPGVCSQAGLKVSSQLLKLAILIEESKSDD